MISKTLLVDQLFVFGKKEIFHNEEGDMYKCSLIYTDRIRVAV